MHERKSLLFSKDDVWVKKDNPSFDVTMGSQDRAEVCELVRLSGYCSESAMTYKATVSSKDVQKFYIGATEQTFKKRYPKHKEAINKKNSSASTSLSTYIWSLKDKGEDPKIKWDIMLADLDVVKFV